MYIYLYIFSFSNDQLKDLFSVILMKKKRIFKNQKFKKVKGKNIPNKLNYVSVIESKEAFKGKCKYRLKTADFIYAWRFFLI